MKTWSDSQLGNNSETLFPTLFSVSQGCHRDDIPSELLSLWTCFLFLASWDASSCLSDSWGSSDTVPTWGDRIQLSGTLPDSRLWTPWRLIVLYMLHNLSRDSRHSRTIPWKSLDEKAIWMRRNNQKKFQQFWLQEEQTDDSQFLSLREWGRGMLPGEEIGIVMVGWQRGYIWSVTIYPEAVVAVDPDFMYGTVWKCWAIMDPDSGNTRSFRLFSSERPGLV